MKNLNLKITALLCIVAMYACNPTLEDEELTISEDEMQNEDLIKLGDANIEAQNILINMLQNEPEVRKELLKIGIEKEGVMLKTLFDPTTESFQRLSPALLNFKSKFTNYFNGTESSSQRTSQENSEELEKLIQTLTDGNMELYMPYIEEEMLESDNLTIVAATLENRGDIAEGYRINLSNSKERSSLPYDPPRLVDVDDDYAAGNSTMIIMPIDDGGGYGGGGYGGGSSGGGSSGGGSTGGGSGTNEIYDSLYRMHVQVAEMKCTNQYDPLIGFNTNGGESEFKFFRAKPEYNFSEDKVEPATHQVQAEMSRKQIRKKWWVEQYVPWDYQWEEGEEIQGFAIYEWDNTDNEVSINGNVKLNLDKKTSGDANIGGEVTAGFSATFTSKHSVLADQDINREYFYDDIKNKVNFGHGFRNGLAIRKAGSLYYTLKSLNYYND
ncbi:hypothetical protein ABWH96_19355 [Marivirga tractuosa]|uniref:hypothetical protein n=1 Tax=Marivirga tractuosa TaxID=1006 RepID=UPI0035CE991D